VLNNNLLLKTIEAQRNCIMKTKGLFVEVMLLNEIVKHSLFKPNFDIERFFGSFRFFNMHIIQ
jgi:hypothetical protein